MSHLLKYIKRLHHDRNFVCEYSRIKKILLLRKQKKLLGRIDEIGWMESLQLLFSYSPNCPGCWAERSVHSSAENVGCGSDCAEIKAHNQLDNVFFFSDTVVVTDVKMSFKTTRVVIDRTILNSMSRVFNVFVFSCRNTKSLRLNHHRPLLQQLLTAQCETSSSSVLLISGFWIWSLILIVIPEWLRKLVFGL